MKLIAILSLIVAVSACSKKEKEGGTGAPSDLVQKLDALATEGCACKDAACADAVSEKVTKLGEGNKDFDQDDLPKLQAIQHKLDDCLANKNPVIVAYLELSKAACECKDKKCGEKVAQKISAWAADLKSSHKKLRQSDANVAMTAGKGAGECLTKLGVPIPQ
jgi:hypothetical protein